MQAQQLRLDQEQAQLAAALEGLPPDTVMDITVLVMPDESGSRGEAGKALDAWKAQFPDVKLTCVGKITSQPGLRLSDARGLRALNVSGYEHFAS